MTEELILARRRAPVSDVVARADAIAATRTPLVPPVKPWETAPRLRVARPRGRRRTTEARGQGGRG